MPARSTIRHRRAQPPPSPANLRSRAAAVRPRQSWTRCPRRNRICSPSCRQNMDSVTKEWQDRRSRRPLVSGAPRQGRRAETAAGSRPRHRGRQAGGADERRAAGDAVRVADRFGRRPREQGKDRGALRRLPRGSRRRFWGSMAPRIRHSVPRPSDGRSRSAVAAVLVTLGVRTVDAHKPVTSKYDYNRDVFPLLRDNCGRCHVEGGVAPMSLMTYKEAVPWAESIRDELTSRPHAAVADGPAKPRRQRDASDQRTRRRRDRHVGGRGNAARLVRRPRQAAPDSRRCRTSGSSDQPDLVVSMESEYTLGANAVEETKDFSIPSGITRGEVGARRRSAA